MTPHEFSKQMNNPYFRTQHFQEESKSAQMEHKIENKLLMILYYINPLNLIKKVRRAKKNPITPIDLIDQIQ